MCRGFKFFPKFLLILLFGVVSVAFETVLAQADFNIAPLSNDRPYSGKAYGDVWGEDDIACLGIWTGYSSGTPFGVGIYDISDPTSPERLSVYKASNNNHNQFEQGVVRDGIGYFASWSGGGVHIVSLTNPSSPQTLSIINSSSNGFSDVHTMFLERDFLYEAAHRNGEQRVKVFDVSDPFAPVFLQNIVTTNTYKVHQITTAKKGDKTILYTSGWGNGGSLPGQTDIWDVTDVGNQPALWLGRIFSGFSSHSSWPTPDGNSLVICRETTGGEVKIYDISDPSAPTLQSEISPASIGLEADLPHNPVIIGNLLFLSWYQNGIQIFDITDRTRPVRVGSYDTFSNPRSQNFEGNWGVYPFLGLDKVLLSDIQSGLWVMDASAVLTGTNNYAPLLVKSPESQLVGQGASATFTSDFTGSSLSYQWRLNGQDVPGATGSAYTIPNVQTNHSGAYSVRAYNQNGSVTSSTANLSLIASDSPPYITAQPQDVLVYPEQSATFSIAVLGGNPLSYYWRLNGVDIPGATESTYTVPIVQHKDAGSYSVIVLNNHGSVLSANATLSLIDSPYINGVTAQPGFQSAIISWNTTLPTDEKVDFGPVAEGSITGSSPRFSNLSTNHSVLLTGLAPGTAYNFQAVSRADGTNYLSAVYQFTTAGGPIILDNTDNEVSFVGSWTPASATSGFHGIDYLFASSVGGSPTHLATFTPSIPFAGKYDIDISYTTGNNRANNTPFTISHANGTSVVPVNQQTKTGQWNSLATEVPFVAGTNGFVRLANNANSSVVIADAVRFTYSANQPTPVDGNFPAWWSEFYFNSVVNPDVDHDDDGFTTGQEYILGTSPKSADQGLNVQVFRSGGNANVMFHPMHANRSYTLQQKSSLAGSTWQPVETESISPGPDGNGVFSLSLNGENQNFYRISVALNTNAPAARSNRLVSGEQRRMFAGAAAEPGCGPTRIYAE